MKTKSKMSGYILCHSSAAAFLLSCTVFASASTINLPNDPPKVQKPKPTKVRIVSVLPMTIYKGATAKFTVTTSGAVTQATTVNYSLGGTGTLGKHYTVDGIPGQVTIQAGRSSANVTVQSLLTSLTAGSETVVVTLQAGTGYKVAKVKKHGQRPTLTILNEIPSPIVITGLSDSAPTPLTPVQLKTTGLKPALPVSVIFSGPNGFSVWKPPIRVGTDGSVIVAVPPYVDPHAGQIGAGSVSISVSQGANQSVPVPVSIKNLPPVSADGSSSANTTYDGYYDGTLSETIACAVTTEHDATFKFTLADGVITGSGVSGLFRVSFNGTLNSGTWSASGPGIGAGFTKVGTWSATRQVAGSSGDYDGTYTGTFSPGAGTFTFTLANGVVTGSGVSGGVTISFTGTVNNGAWSISGWSRIPQGCTASGTWSATPTSQLGNISTRAFVQTGDNVMIGGFIVKGTGPKTVIVRAIGPELTQYGVPNALADPTLELHNGTGALIASNDNWQTTHIGGIITANQVSAIQNGGHAPTQASESAIIATLPPGNYTAIVRGKNNTSGVALVEVYDLSPGTPSILSNISTRAFVQTGDNVMIGGFIVEGTQPKRVIVRAIGPSLTQYGVPNALANPTLELHGTRALIASNDNWRTTVTGGTITSDQVSAIQNSGLPPGDGRESAIIATLSPGNYTAIVRGKNNSTGVALVEVYDLPSVEAYSWDLTDQPGFFGTLMMDAANKFVATELVNKAANGTVTRNAGLDFVDRVSGSSLLIVIGPQGFPSRLILHNDLVVEFISANPTTRAVTWQVRDAAGTVISPPRTDIAPPEFFGITASRSFASLSAIPGRSVGRSNAIESTSPPSIGQVLWTFTKGAASFMAVAGANATGGVGTVLKESAEILAVPLETASDLGHDFGSIVEGSIYGINALSAASFLADAAVVVAGTVAGTVVLSELPVAVLVVGAAKLFSGASSLATTVEGLVSYRNDLIQQGLEATARFNKVIQRAQVEQNAAGYSIRLENRGPNVDSIIRRDEYFESMNRALALLNYAQGVIDNEISDPASKVAAQGTLNAAVGTLFGLLRSEKMSSEAGISATELTLAAAQSDLPGDQECCNFSGGHCCDDVAYDQLVIQWYPDNVLVLQGVVQSLTLMLPPGR